MTPRKSSYSPPRYLPRRVRETRTPMFTVARFFIAFKEEHVSQLQTVHRLKDSLSRADTKGSKIHP